MRDFGPPVNPRNCYLAVIATIEGITLPVEVLINVECFIYRSATSPIGNTLTRQSIVRNGFEVCL